MQENVACISENRCVSPRRAEPLRPSHHLRGEGRSRYRRMTSRGRRVMRQVALDVAWRGFRGFREATLGTPDRSEAHGLASGTGVCVSARPSIQWYSIMNATDF